jgi:hypothetical protein
MIGFETEVIVMPNWPAAKLTDTVVGTDIHAAPLSTFEARKVESQLGRIGLSAAGARQLASGQPMTNALDRQRLAQLVSRFLGTPR